MVSISRDSAPEAFRRYVPKFVFPALMVIPMNYLLGVSYWYSVGLLTLNVLFVLWSFKSRNRWGDRIDFSGSTLTIWCGEECRHSLESSVLTTRKANAYSLILSWNEGEKKHSLIIGGEGFSAERWQELLRTLPGLI